MLTDTIVLSRCAGLLCGDSNVSEAALMLNRGQYRIVCQIDLGMNVQGEARARVMWPLKRLLPEPMGGFPRELELADVTVVDRTARSL